MASLLPNLHSSLLQPARRQKPTSSSALLPKGSPPYNPVSISAPTPLLTSSFAHTKLEPPPVQDKQDKQKNDFYLNLGTAVRTLREDLPLLFTRDLNYDIYRDDITFTDPLNTFQGIDNYKLIFWALRFHGRIFFREISVEVFRVWQPSENVILIRWNLRGVPRVPWEARGQFQGTSRYKLDRNGKIYEHKVDNLAFNFPQRVRPAASLLDLVTACPASPNPTFLWDPPEEYTSSWLQFYRAVIKTLDQEGYYRLGSEGLVTCS